MMSEETAAAAPVEQVPTPAGKPPPVRSAYDQLRVRDRYFVDEYVKCGCGAEAMRRSGYQEKKPGRAREHAWRKMAKPEVRAAIAERRAEIAEAAGVEATAVLRGVAAVAKFNPKLLRDETGKLKPMHELPDEVAAAIASEEFDEKGNLLKYRVHSKPDAQRLLMQYLKLIGNQVELKVPPGQAPLVGGTTVVIVKPEDARAIAQDLESRV